MVWACENMCKLLSVAGQLLGHFLMLVFENGCLLFILWVNHIKGAWTFFSAWLSAFLSDVSEKIAVPSLKAANKGVPVEITKVDWCPRKFCLHSYEESEEKLCASLPTSWLALPLSSYFALFFISLLCIPLLLFFRLVWPLLGTLQNDIAYI